MGVYYSGTAGGAHNQWRYEGLNLGHAPQLKKGDGCPCEDYSGISHIIANDLLRFSADNVSRSL